MIHQYKLNGYNIVLDVFSGSVHLVDEVAYDLIEMLDRGSEKTEACKVLSERYGLALEELEDCLSDIEELTKEARFNTNITIYKKRIAISKKNIKAVLNL